MRRSLTTFKNVAAAGLLMGMLGAPAYAQQTTSNANASMPASAGMGSTNEFGKTNNFNEGALDQDTYTHTWYCDTSIAAKSATGCEVGTAFKRPPSNQFDPLYIAVPLGFTVPPMQMQCPQGLVCVDHPATIDLSAIGGPTNALTPGHDHFTTTMFGGNPEWWDVFVVGVKNPNTYNAIAAHRSFAYIEQLIKNHDPNVTAPIPTNLFLYFAVRPIGQ